MKKIVLGCAAVLLSLGLLAGCNNGAPIEDAVIINVDSEATVIVGESLKLSYTVSPEKADVVAASDNMSIVTAEAQDGTLYLQGVTEGSAVVTLVGTYKKYAEANTNISVKVVTEATEKTEPGVPDTGGTGSGIGGALPEELEGEWLLGYTSGETNYYFNGKVESSYYGGVTTSDFDAVVVTATAVSDGATLTFEDEGVTKYIYMDESSGHHNFSWREESFTWKYDEVYETFVADDSEGAAYFMGNYGTTYQELRLSEYGYLTGEIESENEQYPAHLYEVPTYATPESITITGENTVAVYERITLTATIEPADADPRLVWSWASNDETGEVTVSSTGVVLGVTAGSVTVTATSVADEMVSGSITITVTEASGDAPTTYKLGSLDTTNYCYYWFNGKTITSNNSTYLATSTNWDEAVDVYITEISDDSIDNSCTLSFYDDSGTLKYITYGSNSTQLTIGDTPYTWVWNEGDGNGYFSAPNASSRFIGELTSDGSFRAYASTNLSSYPHAQPFTEKPEDPVKPEQPELEEVTSITSGKSYYLGAQSGEDYQLITGTVTSYKLPTTMDISGAAEVVVTGNDDAGWTLTVNGQYIYAYVYNSNTLELGMSNNATVPSSGVNVFSFDSSSHAFYTSTVKIGTYSCSYLEYYSGNVTLYGASDTSNFSNAAHLYQVVDN